MQLFWKPNPAVHLFFNHRSVLPEAHLRAADEHIDIHMQGPRVRKYCALDDPSQALMKTAMRQLPLTARAYHQVLKLSRTIADLAGSEAIIQIHLAEALRFHQKTDLL